jgi:hypothetical protein
VSDQRTGPTEPRSTTLSAEQEAIIAAFRRHTLLPLDDCLYAAPLRASPPTSSVPSCRPCPTARTPCSPTTAGRVSPLRWRRRGGATWDTQRQVPGGGR